MNHSFQDFYNNHILHEIIYGKSGSSKITVFTIVGALIFVSLVNFSLQKMQKVQKFIVRASFVKMVDFAIQKFQKSISRNVSTLSYSENCTLACPGLYFLTYP